MLASASSHYGSLTINQKMCSSTFFDEGGRPSFQALHHQSAHTIVYYAFDLLHLDGRDLTMAPLHSPVEKVCESC
jgi:hypothetical protein